MRKANSMAELEQLILNEMQKAMTVVHSKSLKDTENEVQSFYSQGSPSIYKRTGKLGKSVRNYGVSKYGKNVHFYIWLDRTYSYVVPNPDFIEKDFQVIFQPLWYLMLPKLAQQISKVVLASGQDQNRKFNLT